MLFLSAAKDTRIVLLLHELLIRQERGRGRRFFIGVEKYMGKGGGEGEEDKRESYTFGTI